MSFAFDLASYEDVRTNAEASTSGSRTEACPAIAAARPSTSSTCAWIETGSPLRARG